MSRDPYLSIRYENLKITLIQDFKKFLEDSYYTFNDLKKLCRDHIPDGKRNTVDSVEKLVDALEEKGALSNNELSMVKVLAEELKLKTLKKEIEQYEWNFILGFLGKASKVAAQIPEKCRDALFGGIKEAVIILKTVLPTVARAGAVGLAVLAVYNNSPEILETSFRELLPYAMNLVGLQRGSLYFMLETSSLSSLQQLWTSYKDGSLKTSIKKVINEIDEVQKLTQGKEIDVTVEIDEDEYREACLVLVLAKSHEFQDVVEKESGKSVQRLCRRRHSLSCRRDLLPPRDNTQLSWQEWRALMEVESKLENEIRRREIRCVEKKNEELKKELEVLRGIMATAEAEKKEMTLRMHAEKKELKVIKGIKDTAEAEKKEMTLRMHVEKINEELKKELEVFKGIKDTAEAAKKEMTLRMYAEKINEELEKKLEAFKGIMDIAEAEKKEIMTLRMYVEKINEELMKKSEVFKGIMDPAEAEKKEMTLWMHADAEKINEELKKELKVIKGIMDTAEAEKKEIMTLRMHVEKINEELKKELEVIKGIKDTAEAEKKEMTLRMYAEKKNE